MKITNDVQVRQELQWVKFALITTIIGAILYGLFLLGTNIFSSSDSLAGVQSTPSGLNAYAKVDSISGTTIYVSLPDETNDQFLKDEKLLIVQMQGNVVGSDTNNNSSFGSVSSIGSVGAYEVLQIGGVSRSSGVIESVTISGSISKSFEFGPNASVQIISYPQLGNGSDFTTTSSIFAKEWDGNTGGVVAFEVDGTLRLAHDIIADGAGFNGAISDNGSSSGCVTSVYTSAINSNYANKGEGIYKNVNSEWVAGRAKIANGGGGGSSHNAGGGGGGNYSAGGDGGEGWSCSSNTYGYGGVALSNFISSDRVFMGGGGGAGEINNGGSSSGGNGGGMIFIHADKIETVQGSGAIKISSNGGDGNTVGGDGAGGGGAGGSIILKVDSFAVDASASLIICANGGDGGNVNHAHSHGAGGGGGQGVVYFSTKVPTQNTTVITTNGKGGANNSNGSSYADNGQGVDDASIFEEANVALPVSLLYFTAHGLEESNRLEWSTSMELNNSHFTLERSMDGTKFEEFHIEDGMGNSNRIVDYSVIDPSPYAVTFYRLSQTDFDGTHEVLGVRVVRNADDGTRSLKVYPNPLIGSYFQIEAPDDYGQKGVITVTDMTGKLVKELDLSRHMNQTVTIDASELPQGTYVIQWTNGKLTLNEKLIKR